MRSYGLSHGDMLYLTPLNGAMLWTQETNPKPSTSSNNTPSGEPVDSVEQSTSSARRSISLQEDEVDLQLWKLDGKVQRKRDEKL